MDIIKEKKIIPRVLADFVVVEVETHFKKSIKHGSLELEMPESWAEYGEDKFRLAITSGMAIATPDHQSNTSSIHPDVEVGDKIYFHYNAINRGQSEIKIPNDDRKIHRISYGQIFCTVKPDGEIVMIGGRVLCKPYNDGDLDTFNGASVQVSKSGLIVAKDVRHSSKRAVVAHIGKNYIGRQAENLVAGDVIMYEPNADFENEVEGQTYFVMTQEDIICKLTNK